MHFYMNRLGFVNFWDFKNEEIYFNKGNALIRGENGSGKSIVLQSAIVYLLDGSMRPERLDPSGTTSRQMSYYLLGNDEMITDATGYLYLEFYHPEKQSYLTIGTGLHAKRNAGVDFWGFSIDDGRRIGKDINLYKEEGTGFLPLTKKECRNLIKRDSENFFTEKQQEYERNVNRLLFGLTDKKYKELLTFLMEIRKPIAGADSKKGLKFIYEKLNTSLPVMKEEDLASLSISLQSMDALENTLKELQSTRRIVKKISDAYDVYQDALLYEKFKEFEKLKKEYVIITGNLEKDTKGLSDKKAKRDLLKSSLDRLMEEQEEVSAKLFTLKNTGNFEEIERIHQELDEAKKKEDKFKHQIEEAEEDEISLGYKIKETEDQKYQHQKEIKNIWENLDEYAWELDLPFHQEYKDESSYGIVSGLKEQSILFRNHLEECLKLIEEKESYEGKLDAEKTKGILTQNKIQDYHKAIKRYEEEYEESKRYLIKEIKSYAASCQILELDSHIHGISRLIEEERWEEAKKGVFELFYEKNNHYQERNGFIKARFEETSDEKLRKELDKNILKVEILKKEYFGFPTFQKANELNDEIRKLGYYLEKENEFLDRQEEDQAAIENTYGIILKRLQESVSKYGFLYQTKSDKYRQLLKIINNYINEIHQMEKEIQNLEMCDVMLFTYVQRKEEITDNLMDLRYEKEETERSISHLEHRLGGLKTDVEQEELLSLSKRSEANRNQIASMKAEIGLLESSQIPEMEEKISKDIHVLEGKEKELAIVEEQLEKECGWIGMEYDPEILKEEIHATKISVEESMDILINIYKDHETDMLLYQPRLERKMVTMDYSRYFLTFKNLLPKELLKNVTEEIKDKEGLLDEQETTLYQKVLLDTAAQKMIYKIKQSKDWVDKISERMRNLKTTSGMVFNLKWVPKKAETQNEMDTAILEQIISKKQEGKIEKEDLERIKNHFSSKLKQERIYAANEGLEMDYEAVIRNCFDYRNWYEFKMYLTEPGFKEKELTNKRFMSLSGGERATAIYSSLLSALNSLYSECEVVDHPRFMGLDEAFTVCDSSNTDAVFEFISQMDLEYLLNSQTLWGTYPSVKNLAISHLTHDEKSRSVAITRFTWNGKERRPVFTKY